MLRRPGVPQSALPLLAVIVAGTMLSAPRRGHAEIGCCQYSARPADGPAGPRQPRCADTTRAECNLLRPYSVYFKRWSCDDTIQRCVVGLRTRTPTPTPTATPTRTPTATPERVGCCQLDNVSRLSYALCANAINETSCLTEYDGTPTFCAECSCDAQARPGFTFGAGRCVQNTPTPTPTPTPAESRGCCQLNRGRGPHGSICGNDISMDSCLGEFGAGATFCPECVCSSHSDPGFELYPGVCRRQSAPTRPRRPARPVRPQRP